ncbi:hypothetical protein Dimus_021013 [Dionaea muscipula]
MAAEVSQQMKSDSKSSALITRDFLGGGGVVLGIESEELDLDLHVPSGWEKRLDLKSGRVSIQRCGPLASSDTLRKHDLHDFHPHSRATLNLLEDTSLDLKLVSPNSSSSTGYQSVCTLDKVKSALNRAERESSTKNKRSTSTIIFPSSPSNSSSSLSVREIDDDDIKLMLPGRLSSLTPEQSSLMVAAACPGCLLYVLISKSYPKCPKCSCLIPMPFMSKKPRIDLNMSI